LRRWPRELSPFLSHCVSLEATQLTRLAARRYAAGMIDVDRRTRFDADARQLDFIEFCEEAVPRLLAGGYGQLAGRGIRALGLAPLAIEVDGRVYTWGINGDGFAVSAGDRGAGAVASMPAAAFSDLMQERRSTVGLVIGNDVRMLRGTSKHFLEWEPIFRALIDGRPVYEPGSVTFSGRDGSALDLHRAFGAGDSRAEMAHFLGEAGYLKIAGVFSPDEMTEVSGDIDRSTPAYAPDDGRSWWAKTRSGEHRPVRLQNFQEHSPAVRRLLDDARLLAIADLTVNGHRDAQRRDGNAIEALVKPIGVVEGISDVSWHKDCSLGRHSYDCCRITVGISVTDADAESGQLCVVAGSHRASIQLRGIRDDLDLPRVGLPTKAGDVTVHLSCTLHMSIPPVSRERRVMYTGFELPPRVGETVVDRDPLYRVRESAPKRVEELGSTSITADGGTEEMNRFDTRGVRSVR